MRLVAAALAFAAFATPGHDDVRELLELEARWIGVYSTHDLAFLERIIAADFVATLADGSMRGKAEHIAAYPADFDTYSSVTSSDVKVRLYGADVAVATGLYTATLRASGERRRYRFTDTWLRRDGSWRCIATHENQMERPAGHGLP